MNEINDLIKQLQETDSSKDDKNIQRNVNEFAEDALEYLLQLFHVGLEGRHGQRISIQCADDGTFRGVIAAVIDLGKSSQSGVVSFTNSSTIGGVLEHFEDGLSHGDLKWRVDKYYQVERKEETEGSKPRSKIAKRL